MNTQEIAWKIYLEIYGDIDDKRFQAQKLGEIEDWLEEGDLDGTETPEQLADEWKDYNGWIE